VTKEEIIQCVHIEIERLESMKTYTDSEEDSRWGAIGALESLLEKINFEG